MVHHRHYRVLIIEDEPATAAAVARALEDAGFLCSTACSGYEGLDRIKSELPDVVVLDLRLPDIDGLDVAKEVLKDAPLPIIMLTARDTELDRIVGLEVGALDYVTKPFSLAELVARVRAIVRRLHRPPRIPPPQHIKAGDILIDVAAREVLVKGKPVRLTRTEFVLLRTLVQNRGNVVPRHRLAAAVWGTEDVPPSLIEVHISNIRRKIGDTPGHPRKIVAVRSVGYRLNA